MTALSTQTLSYVTGAVPTLTPAGASDDCDCPSGPGQLFMVFRNSNVATRTIAVVMAETEEWGAVKPAPGTANVYTLGATTGELWIPMHPDYNNGSGRITVTCTPSVTNVTSAAVRIK